MTDYPAEPPIEVHTQVTPGGAPLITPHQVKVLARAARQTSIALLIIGHLGIAAWGWMMWTGRRASDSWSYGSTSCATPTRATATDA